MFNGDSCQVLKGIPSNSIDFGIHSPPFANLYTYSNSEADLGNCVDDDEFIRHYEYIISELFRTTVYGRLCAVHCKDLPRYANRDDTAGLKDFPGKIIAAFERHNWSFHSRVTIWKCPVVERERTNNNGLLHKTALRDRSQLRQGMADYLIVFRKPPLEGLMSDKPIRKYHDITKYLSDGTTYTESVPVGFKVYVGDLDPRHSDEHPSKFARKRSHGESRDTSSINIWRRYAEPVWWDIQQTDVLNNWNQSGNEKDERHICPLQLQLIERSVELWSNPCDTVLSPFAGIGSEGVGALRHGRKFVGCELKTEYYTDACRNLEYAANVMSNEKQPLLAGFTDET
jgi:DNA modification methylase